MSIRLMTTAWSLNISPTDKLVLLALADWSNDDGICWPSMKQLSDKSGLTDRAIRTSIGRLCEAGHLTRKETPGKGVSYRVHPGIKFPPELNSPRNETTQTPERRSANTSITTSSLEADASKQTRARKAGRKKPQFALPADIPETAWSAYEAMRRTIRKPMTDRARELAVAKLRELAEHGYPPGDVLDQSTLNSWQGLFPIKDHRNGQHGSSSFNRSEPQNAMVRAALAFELRRQNQGGDGDGDGIPSSAF